MREMRRRRFLSLAAMGCGWTLTGASVFAAPPDNDKPGRGPVWLSAYATDDAQPRYGVAAFDAAGKVRFSCPLPGRAHGVTPHPDGTHAVVMARRPGRWSALLDLATGSLRGEATALPADRRGTGHGVFNAAGYIFYMAEDDTGRERGALTLLDPRRGYARIGEIADVGVGPHEILALDGGRMLAVADGGVLTHPDTGRVKLNLDDMDPALHYVDTAAGKVVQTLRLPADYSNLGIRHIAATADGAVVFGMQDERPTGEVQPLVGVHRPGEPLRLLDAPAEAWRRLAGYVGSVAVTDGRIFASSPRGGAVAAWDGATGGFLEMRDLSDGCGLAADPAGGAAATSGFGRIIGGDGRDIARTPGYRWDNHLSAPLFIA
jgi:uncharacterized protein